jgi:hypothetical protein
MQRQEEKRASVSTDDFASMLREVVSEMDCRWHTSSCECSLCRARTMLRRYRGDVMSPVGVRWEEPE